jgi:hypothetical protein
MAHRRFHAEPFQAREVMVCADALDLHLLPKVGAAWMPKGSQEAVMTPGKNAKHYLAGALNVTTGEILHGRSTRKTNALFRDLLTLLDHAYPAPRLTRISVVVDHDCIHQAKAVGQWIESHPRFALLWLPTYGPQANPIARALGDGHGHCQSNHTRKRLRDMVSDVEWHLRPNGPWLSKRSQLVGFCRRYMQPRLTGRPALAG